MFHALLLKCKFKMSCCENFSTQTKMQNNLILPMWHPLSWLWFSRDFFCTRNTSKGKTHTRKQIVEFRFFRRELNFPLKVSPVSLHFDRRNPDDFFFFSVSRISAACQNDGRYQSLFRFHLNPGCQIGWPAYPPFPPTLGKGFYFRINSGWASSSSRECGGGGRVNPMIVLNRKFLFQFIWADDSLDRCHVFFFVCER